MNQSTALLDVLQEHFPIHRARARFLAAFVLALIRVRSVDLSQVALALNADAQPASNYRRIQRFFADFALDQRLVARLVVGLLPCLVARLVVGLLPCPPGGYLVSLDRTEWSFGRAHTRVLVAALCWRSMALPVAWAVVPGRGNTDMALRQRVLDRLFAVVAPERVGCLVADREFIGRRWFGWLCARGVPFVIRVTHNAVVPTPDGWRDVAHYFRGLRCGEPRLLRHRRTLYGHKLSVAGVRLSKKPGDYLIVASNRRFRGRLADPLGLYGARWQIETLFGAMKSRGFDLEATHLRHPERIERLVGLVSVALAWAHRVGEHLAELKPIRRKKHGRRAISLFRYGLDHLRRMLLSGRDHGEFRRCLLLLSCT